jgi:hypothetical protein
MAVIVVSVAMVVVVVEISTVETGPISRYRGCDSVRSVQGSEICPGIEAVIYMSLVVDLESGVVSVLVMSTPTATRVTRYDTRRV